MNLKMTNAQKTLYYIAENMKMEKKISAEGYEHFQQAIKVLEQQPSDDCVSREKAIVQLSIDLSEIKLPRIKESLDKLPSVTPTHGTCKDCKKYNRNEMFCTWHGGYLMYTCDPNFYCADFEKRGNETK